MHPEHAGAAPAPRLREVERVAEGLSQHSDRLEDQDKRYKEERQDRVADHSTLGCVQVLHAEAPKDIPLVEMVLLKFLATKPAPLIIASPNNINRINEKVGLHLRAGDMVTSALFPLCPCLALRAVSEIFVGLCILKELSIRLCIKLFTALAFVPYLTALEAHLKIACRASSRLASLALFNIAQTARRWTPFKLWVQVDDDVFMEPQILSINLLGAKLANILSCIY